jgi:hypothetical protein
MVAHGSVGQIKLLWGTPDSMPCGRAGYLVGLYIVLERIPIGETFAWDLFLRYQLLKSFEHFKRLPTFSHGFIMRCVLYYVTQQQPSTLSEVYSAALFIILSLICLSVSETIFSMRGSFLIGDFTCQALDFKPLWQQG